MNRLRTVALVATSAIAVLAIAAAPASAGTANVVLVAGTTLLTDCDVTVSNSASPPASPIAMSGITSSSCSAGDVVMGGGTLTIGTTASFTGAITFDLGFWSCTYTGTLQGPAAGTELVGNMNTSGFLCPDPAEVFITSITY